MDPVGPLLQAGVAEEGHWRARYKDESWYTSDTSVSFAVPAGDLGYSVSVFCGAALLCLLTLMLRRRVLGGELGGPFISKWLTAIFFVGLWFGYIYLSIKNAQAS